MKLIKLAIPPEFLESKMGMPNTAKIVSIQANNCGVFEFGIAIEGDFPDRAFNLQMDDDLFRVGDFLRDPSNPRYDGMNSKGSTRGEHTVRATVNFDSTGVKFETDVERPNLNIMELDGKDGKQIQGPSYWSPITIDIPEGTEEPWADHGYRIEGMPGRGIVQLIAAQERWELRLEQLHWNEPEEGKAILVIKSAEYIRI